MAGKSPAELKSEGEELKALFAKIKKKQHNCAILMSKDGVVVEAHVKKSPDILVKAAKKNGGMAKGAWGTITMEGQVLILDPINDKVPGNLGKIAKKYFTERSLKLRLEIKAPEEEGSENEEEATEESSVSGGGAPSGTEEESSVSGGAPSTPEQESSTSGGEEPSEDDESTSVSGGGGEPEVDKRAELEKRLEDIQKDIDELESDTESVMHSALMDALRAHERAMDEENFDRASETLRTIETVLEDYETIMGEKRPLMARMAKLESDAQKVADGADPDAAQGIGIARRAFVGAIDNNEWYGAREQLDKIEEYIDNADLGGGQQEENTQTDTKNEEESTTTEENVDPATPEQESSTSENTNEPSAPEEESSVSGGDPSPNQDDESTSVSGGENEVDSRRAEMEARMAEIQSEIDELEADTGNVMHSSLIDALRKHEQAMADEEYDRANDAFTSIRSVLADYEGLVAEKRPLMQRMAKMEADAQKVISGDDPIAKEDIERAQRAFAGAIDNNEWFGAGEQLDKIEAVIEAAGVSGGNEEEATSNESPDSNEPPESGTTAPTEDEVPTVEVDPEEVQDEINERLRTELEARLETNKKDINGLLRKKDSENGKAAVEAITAYSSAMKSGNFGAAEDALDTVEEVIEKEKSEFSLDDKQREAIMKALEKMEAELDSLADELAE